MQATPEQIEPKKSIANLPIPSISVIIPQSRMPIYKIIITIFSIFFIIINLYSITFVYNNRNLLSF